MSSVQSHRDLEDPTFLSMFASQQLSPALFDHEAHLRLAYLHVKLYSLAKAETNVSQQLFNFVKALGDRDKFHKTLTIAAVKAVYHFVNRAPTASFEELLEKFPRLKNDFRKLITTHYSASIFKNDRAKREYLEPDLLAFS
jgi:tryptophan 2,3-dioxygenase